MGHNVCVSRNTNVGGYVILCHIYHVITHTPVEGNNGLLQRATKCQMQSSFIQDLAQTAWQVPTVIELDPTIFQKNPKSKNRALQISNDSITNSNYFLFNVLVRNLHVDLEEDPRP